MSASLRSWEASPPRVRLPFQSGAVFALGSLAAVAVGVLIAVDPRFGAAALLAAVFVPTCLLSLPLGVVLWTPLAFNYAVPFVNLASMAVLGLIGVAWLATYPMRRAALREILRTHSALLWVLTLLIVWMTATVAWATDPGASSINLINWYMAMIGFLVIATTITTRRHLLAIALALIAGAVVATAIGFAPSGGATALQDGRIAGGLGDPNYLAAGIVVSLAIAAGLVAALKSNPIRWSLVATIAFLLIGLAATGSRGGMIAAAISILGGIMLIRSGTMKVGAVIATVIAALGIWFAANSSGMIERFREFDTGGTGRVDLWNIAWKMSEDHLLTGVGVNNFRAESTNYVREPGSPTDVYLITENPHVVHNIYLQQLAETGLVGLTLLLGAFAICLRTTWRAIKRLDAAGDSSVASFARAILVAQIGALSASIFLSNAYDTLLWILMALSLVLTTLAQRAERTRAPLP